MAKLKLNLDDLKVESFATTPELSRRRGTVFGQVTQAADTCAGQVSCYDYSCTYCQANTDCYGTCGGAQTCAINCNSGNNTCGGDTCAGCYSGAPGCNATVDPSCMCSGTGCQGTQSNDCGSCIEGCTGTCAFNTQVCADTCNAGTGACGPTCGEVSCNNEYTCPGC